MEKMFVEIALGMNVLLALIVASCYLFKRYTVWPIVRAVIMEVLKG